MELEMCTKMLKKNEWKTQSKISCHYTWLLHGKNCPSRWHFLRSFLTPSLPSRRSITTAKRKEKEKKERRKKNSKIEKPKDIGLKIYQNSDFCSCPSHHALNRDTGGKNGKLLCCKCIFDQIKAYLAEIQPENHQNVQKYVFLQKAPGVNGLKINRWDAIIIRVACDIESGRGWNFGSCQLVLKTLIQAWQSPSCDWESIKSDN